MTRTSGVVAQSGSLESKKSKSVGKPTAKASGTGQMAQSSALQDAQEATGQMGGQSGQIFSDWASI